MFQISTAPLNELALAHLGQRSPLRMEQWLKADIDSVSKLVVDKLPSDTTIGIHGTSLHAIRAMLDKGKLPAGAVKGDFTEGCLYFEPNLEALRNFAPTIPAKTLSELKSLHVEYQGYTDNNTGTNARKHAILYFLNLDFTEKENHDLVFDISVDIARPQEKEHAHVKARAIAALVAKGVGEDHIKMALKLCKDFQGVLIGLKANVLKDFPLLPNPNKSEAPRIVVPYGLEYQYITGIVPLGSIEREFFRRLQRL